MTNRSTWIEPPIPYTIVVFNDSLGFIQIPATKQEYDEWKQAQEDLYDDDF